jgi:hypothetical protein
MDRKWTLEYMRERFPAEVKEKLLKQGLDPKKKPTHRWLRNNGFRSFLRRIPEHGYAPDEFLLEECDFETRSAEWPCTNRETIEHIEEWIQYLEEVGERINGRTIEQVKTHLRRCMEVAEDYIGTTDILKLGQGERAVCVSRTKQLMKGLKQEYPNSGTRQNYVTTIRDFIADKYAEGVLDWDPVTYEVAKLGWGWERERPEHVATTDHVLVYFQACKTRVEQMLILSLAGYGFRNNELSGDERHDAYNFDAPIPHIDFSKNRKNGEGRVPMVVGVEFSREYFQTLAQHPDYDGRIFPSNSSEDGCRSEQWVRDKVAEIGERTDVTLPNGEKLKPKDFRRFWYTLFSNAYSEWLDQADTVASIQGSESGRVAAESYFGDSAWFNHYIKFVRPKLENAFPDKIEPVDNLGNIDVDIKGDEPKSGQTSLDEYGSDDGINSAQGPFVAVCGAYAVTTDWIVEKFVNLVPDGTNIRLSDAIEKTTARKITFGFGMAVFSIALLVSTFANLGVSVNPVTGEVAVPREIQRALVMALAIDYFIFQGY